MSIKTKISGPVFLLVATLMGLLTLAGYRYLAHALEQTVSRHHSALLALAAAQIDNELLHQKEMLRLRAKGIAHALTGGHGAQAKELELAKEFELVKGTGEFFNGGLEVTDREGKMLAQSPTIPKEAHLDNSTNLAMALATGQTYISAPYSNRTPPYHATISFSVPIMRDDGSVAGLLVAHHDLFNANKAQHRLNTVGSKGRIIVMHRNRTIISHPDPARLLDRVLPGEDQGLDDAIQKNRPAHGKSTDPKGETWVTTATPLKHAEWIVAVQYPESEAYLALKQARSFFAGALAVILVLTLMTLCRLIGRVTGPLSCLIDHVRSLSTGRGGERHITLATGDEVEDLALAVNQMVGEMDKRQETLEENRELYRIIADFTSELALLRNPDGTIRYISSNCEALTGYTDREFIEKPQLLESIIHPQDAHLWNRCDVCTRSKAQEATLELRLVTRKGETRWFRYTCHEVPGSDGRCLGLRGSFRDISQDRLLEGMLESERQFAESLLENTSTPLFVIDQNHRIIVWNRAMTELTGLHAGDMIGSDNQWQAFYREKRPTLCDLVMSGETGEIDKLYRTYSRDVVMKGMVRAEGWYQNLNGKDRYLFFDASPVLRDGKTVAVVETLYDITERARAEESLRLFSQAVEQSANSILITDPSGTIQYVNRKFCEVSGYTAEEALGRKPSILKSGRHPKESYRHLWETITSGREWHGEFHNKRKDGTFYWESALITPICDQDGNLTRFLSIKEEITARKNSERQLMKNQAELVLKHEQLTELFRQVERGKREWEQTMDCVDDMVAMVDGEGRIRRCNRAFEKITGQSYSRLLSSNWRTLLRDAGLDLDRLEGSKAELYHEPSRRWLTLRTYPYGDRGGTVIMLHDLTEVKLVSEQLAVAYQELKETHSQLLQQEKMASIGQLAAGVAHEINNPMGFISSNLGTMGKYLERLEGFLELQSAGMAEVATQELKAQIAEARRRFKIDYVLGDARSLLAESQDGAERVRTIVQNLKSFSRVDDARASYVDLNDCLDSTITIAWNELKYKTTLTRDYGELPPVKCLPQQVNQVFLNILVNAAHAIEKQGEITITTRRQGEEVTIAIRDTGSGIPEEIKTRIFEPFFTTKEVGKGTGLGLSISYDIIKKHKGSIEVESSPQDGTTFTITLPIEGAGNDPDPDTVRR